MKRNIWFMLISMIFISCGGGDDSTPDNDDNEPEPLSLANCPIPVSNETLDVLTWNIQEFPKTIATLSLVEQIIEIYDLDVIALQEITSLVSFNLLVTRLEGWSGSVTQVNGSNLMVGYLYKDSEVTLDGVPFNLYEEGTSDNNNAFTAFRRPYLMKVNHTNGLSVNLINIHLKCCDGSEDRRRAAADLLKTYIDDNLASEEVIVLGDYNDEIIDSNNVFQVFLDDPLKYKFTTLPIAEGPSTGWSFPSFPSQIDNVLITDELFDNEISTEVVSIDNCISTYNIAISDHRPVLIRLRADQ